MLLSFFSKTLIITNSTHKASGKINFFSIWQTNSHWIRPPKMEQQSFALPMIISFGVWLLITDRRSCLGFADSTFLFSRSLFKVSPLIHRNLEKGH